LTLPSERQEKTVNSTLKVYVKSSRVEEQGLVIYLWNKDRVLRSLGQVQVLKCQKKQFFLVELLFGKVVKSQAINAR
jgi:hypothetical protein